MATYTYKVTGDPKVALTEALSTLQQMEYSVTQDSEWSATAEVGSSAKVALLGAVSPHIRLSVQVAAQADGAIVTLAQTTTGAAGGLIGMSRVRKAVKNAGEGVRKALQATGQLVDTQVS
ncbi:MAG: hypothetical protein GEV07_08370 [Streptosporangiales bacterium]|nr:hypothetical protein [Streptosporangiales bacterium]